MRFAIMKLYPRTVFCALGLMAASACSHPATSSSEIAPSPDAKGDVVVPARMTANAISTMRISSVGSRPSGTVEIPVDASGRPDIYGIRFIGTFSDVTRRDIADFVSQASFIPAMRNGVPEKGVVKMTFR